ncbi:MAG: hypothetical protein QOE06_3602 [Thermoleophilaceae bacterium]|nr:hypothetical protein [Thermoleophilaceae bacterium]
MRMGSRVALLCAAIAVLAPGTASAASPFGGVTVQRSDLHPGDTARGQGVSAVVPPAGHGVVGQAEGPGGSHTLIVNTDSKGRVSVTSDPASSGGAAAASSPGPCSDGAYVLLGYKWYGSVDWYFHATATPPEITQINARHDLEHGTENMKWENNDCGLPNNSSASSAYIADTGLNTGINNDATCGSDDGVSVVGFGTINGSSILAVTCTWYISHSGYSQATASDMKFDKDTFTWYTGSTPGGCSNKWSLEDVATHERGHTFGLGHPDEANHGNLTMSPNINGPCQKSEATLGLGDVNGMNALY